MSLTFIVLTVLEKIQPKTASLRRKPFNSSLLNVISTLIALHSCYNHYCAGYKRIVLGA